MSKFNFDLFFGDYPIVVSKERYTEQKAIEIARNELGVDEVEKRDGYVRYGYGVDDDDISAGPRNAWWLTLSNNCPKRCCPVWAFRARRTDNLKKF